MEPIAGFLVPPRLPASPWSAGSLFVAKVLGYNARTKVAFVLLDNEVFQVKTEADLVKNQILHLVAEKNSVGRLIWRILPNSITEKDRSLNEWAQTFLKYNLAPQAERIQARRLFFGNSSPEWGAQAEARNWPDSVSFIGNWAQAESLLNLGNSSFPDFPPLTPQGKKEIDQWNSAKIMQFPLLRLFPVQYRVKDQLGQGWIKTWSFSYNSVFRWTFLTSSFDLPLLLSFHSGNITLRLLKRSDERLFSQDRQFNLNIQKILGRSFRWSVIQNALTSMIDSQRGVDVHA